MKENRRGGHTVSCLTAHIVWVTKYRYHVLEGEIKERCRAIIRQTCESEDVRILKGVVSRDHVHKRLSSDRLQVVRIAIIGFPFG